MLNEINVQIVDFNSIFQTATFLCSSICVCMCVQTTKKTLTYIFFGYVLCVCVIFLSANLYFRHVRCEMYDGIRPENIT